MNRIVFGILLFLGTQASAQLKPVNWSFTSKKLTGQQYEICLTATIQKGWHLFSQYLPADAINVPTSISFNKNPLVILQGKITELGKLELFQDRSLGISAKQYSNKVQFVQKVKRTKKVKTVFSGTVEFQTCDDHKCLPSSIVNFSVALN
jgi:thiol:disulfide interchange protein DsbD